MEGETSTLDSLHAPNLVHSIGCVDHLLREYALVRAIPANSGRSRFGGRESRFPEEQTLERNTLKTVIPAWHFAQALVCVCFRARVSDYESVPKRTERGRETRIRQEGWRFGPKLRLRR